MTECLPRLNGLMSVFVRKRDGSWHVRAVSEGIVRVGTARHTAERVVLDRDAWAAGPGERISLIRDAAFRIVLGRRLHTCVVLRERGAAEAVKRCRRGSSPAGLAHPTAISIVVLGDDWIRSTRWASQNDAREIVVLKCRRSATKALGCNGPVRIDRPSNRRQRC
jgi:hypothetical protein